MKSRLAWRVPNGVLAAVGLAFVFCLRDALWWFAAYLSAFVVIPLLHLFLIGIPVATGLLIARSASWLAQSIIGNGLPLNAART